MAKKPNHSTPPKPLTKPASWLEAKDWQAFIYDPKKEKWRQQLIASMFEFFQDESKVELEQFCFEYKLSRKVLYKWRQRYPDLEEAVDEIKLLLASRRRVGALKRQYDKEVVMKDLHTYDPEWLLVNKYWSELKKSESADVKPSNIVIEMKSYAQDTNDSSRD